MEQEMDLNVAVPEEEVEAMQENEAMPLAEPKGKGKQGEPKNDKVFLALEEMGLTAEQCEDCMAIIEKVAKEKVAELEKEMYALKLNFAVDAALQKAGAINPKAVKPFLENMDSVVFDGAGNVEGLAEQVARLKMSSDTKFLFHQEQPRKFRGATVGEGSDEEDKRPNFLGMKYSDMMEFLERNPDAVI